MADLPKLSALMKSDWDRRIRHDYRFWMSDGYKDDHTMWESGERDFAIITEALENCNEKTVLEIGCGVGRLLRPALTKFKKVLGLDISEQAISKAKEFLSEQQNLALVLGNGTDLRPIEDQSTDVVISFAALTSMPVDVMANYLIEAHRVLRPGGVARLQLYLGSEQPVRSEDTLHLRCYRSDHFRAAASEAGFEVQWIKELLLPFQVSFKEIGIEAVVVSLLKCDKNPQDLKAVSKLLLPQGETTISEGQDLEYWMTLNYAKELAERGELDRARSTLEYALSFQKTASIDVSDVLARIVSEIERKERGVKPLENSLASPAPVNTSSKTEDALVFDRNMAVLKKRFPDTYSKMLKTIASLAEMERISVAIRSSEEGQTIWASELCLDHPSKPGVGATAWVQRLLNSDQHSKAKSMVVYGFGGGYHIEALIKAGVKNLCVIEPSLAVFRAALGSRDLFDLLTTIDKLSVGTDQVPNFFDENCELVFRPQSQTLFGDYAVKLRSVFYGNRGLGLLKPNIGIVGPIMGGTLPIMSYTTRALGELQQRARQYDMSGFAQGFDYLEKFTFNRNRTNSLRNTYCEMLSHVLLETTSEKPVDILFCMAQAPVTPRLLMELRKRGVLTVLWFVEDYLRFTYWKEMAQFYDFVFTIQKGECIPKIRAAGAGEVHYLPVGCDPEVHAPYPVTAEERARWGSPISFVGAGYHNRQQVFASLADMPLKLWGTEWPNCRPFDRLVQEGGRRLTPGEYVKIFNASTININLHSSTEKDGVDPSGDFLNPRTFELAATGAFQLVDERTLLPEAFHVGKEIATFRSTPELKDRTAYYLSHEDERVELVRKARARALQEHTYVHRMKSMLALIYSSHFERLKRRLEEGPWTKTFARAKKFSELHQRCVRAFERGEEPNLDGLISDIVIGKGKLSETEQKLLFLHHIKSQIIRMKREEAGEKQ